MSKGRHASSRKIRGLVIVVAVIGVLVLAVGAAAYAAYRYEQVRADRILPGVRIEGVDVSGMTRTEAEQAVRVLARRRLGADLVIDVGGRRWTTSAADLGRRAAVAEAVERAVSLSAGMGTFDRFWHRFREEPLGVEIGLAFGDASGVEDLVSRIAGAVAVEPRNAAIGTLEDGSDIRFIPARAGAELPSVHAARVIASAIDRELGRVRLSTRPVQAPVTVATLGPTIVVRVDRNRLELYDGFEIVQTWDVATAKPGYTTPAGVWNIWDKRENPTWYNPALDSWGASLPAVVPGGPGNPMGTRAIYIDAPGLIRIHGTTDPSSIGRYASHGCIRMRNEEVEDLFERIPVGAHVVVVGHRPAGAQYWDTPGLSDI